MKKSPKFSPEVRERAVRMVQEHRGEYPSLWAAIESIAPKIGCVPQTLNEWVKRDEVDSGTRAGSKRPVITVLTADVFLSTASAITQPGSMARVRRVKGHPIFRWVIQFSPPAPCIQRHHGVVTSGNV